MKQIALIAVLGLSSLASFGQTKTTTSGNTKSEGILNQGAKVLESAGKTLSGIIDKYSKMMQVSPSSISNVVMYQFVDEWYGTKYRLGGTTRSGIDCSALVQKCYKYVYGMDMVRTSILQFRMTEYIADKAKLKEGDLVFFRIHGGPVSHVGVYLQNNYFVHASSSRGVMVSNLNDSYWIKHYVGGGRVAKN
jgi:cell wall-associated NlpC family hydrolase